MRKLYLFFLLSAFFLGTELLAQSSGKKLKITMKADRLYERLAYAEAVELYKKSWNKNKEQTDLALQLSRCYYHLREPKHAIQWFQKATDSLNHFTPADKLHYAQMLESAGFLEEAKNWYNYYSNETGNKNHISGKIRAIENQEAFCQDSAFYTIKPVSINSENSDFSPSYFAKGIVFTSAKTKTDLFKSNYGWNDQPYLDLFYTEIVNNNFAAPIPFGKKINTDYHEGPAAFYDNDTKMIFTRNNYAGGQKGINEYAVNHLNLFLADAATSALTEWKNIRPFPYNNPEYSVGHPTISKDGNLLYFISDMPGGIGGTDLYVSKKDGNSWGKPTNLGEPINTTGNEMFPFIHQNGYLYFSSDGHGGLGSLDIFKVDLNEKVDSLQQIINLGIPVNSKSDDFGYILDEKEGTGYFSSNRSQPGDNDDLFYFTYSEEKPSLAKKAQVIVSGKVIFEKNKLPTDSAKVIVKNSVGEKIHEIYTPTDGTFEFSLDADQEFKITASKTGYVAFQKLAHTTKDSLSMELPLAKEVKVTGTLTNKETGDALTHTNLELLDLGTKDKQKQTTDTLGQYSFFAISDHSYQLKVDDKKKFFNKVIVIDSTTINTGTVKTDVEVEEIVLHKAITIENIYYDLNKATIRPEAAEELDKLVQLLKENPSIVVELSSHTDCRGSDKDNLELSDRRAKIAARYIVNKGIEESRIIGKGYGEYKLVNDCVDENDCPEEKHQQNRRTEFAVIKH